MRYRLRTLLILLAVGPMMLAGVWLTSVAIHHRFLAIDKGYNFGSERSGGFNQLIDLIEETEKNLNPPPPIAPAPPDIE